MSRVRIPLLAPWRRAPFLLVRSPGVFVAVAVGAAVLAVAAASGPLFLSSTGSAALRRAAAATCPQAPLPSVTYPRQGIGQSPAALRGTAGLRRVDRAVRAAFADRRRRPPTTCWSRTPASRRPRVGRPPT